MTLNDTKLKEAEDKLNKIEAYLIGLGNKLNKDLQTGAVVFHTYNGNTVYTQDALNVYSEISESITDILNNE